MGVVGLFIWILKKYENNNIVTDTIECATDILYIDANCLIHPVCFKTLEEYSDTLNFDDLEAKMIDNIIEYIKYLINYANPKIGTYIAVDGVAPMSKINQQRKRRYKSYHDTITKDNLKKKHNIPINNIWTNTSITPGTKFMEKLHQELQKFAKEYNRPVIYTSCYDHGEGEHKILQHIKETTKKYNSVIYSMDADVIFLSITSGKNNIHLLREEQYVIENNKSEKLKYVSIDKFKYHINQLTTNNHFTDDFVFVCYFIGNDFLPHLPSIDIKNGGLDHLINIYQEIYDELQESIVFGNKLNNKFIRKLIIRLAHKENYYFTNIFPRNKEYYLKKTCPISITDEYEKELWAFENLKNIDIYDPIKLGYDYPELWKYRYYEHYFGATYYQEKLVTSISYQYLDGLRWVFEYYFNKCVSWSWQYEYVVGPFISDIANYVHNVDFNNIKFKLSKPLEPHVQLLLVIPPQYKYMLPEKYQKYMEILVDLFPERIALDYINKDYHWKCIPRLPIVNLERILQLVKN
jgi:5'-3' exonuclease